MNIYIMTDLEGISGITSREQVLSEAARYAEGRRLMVDDINVVVRACKEAMEALRFAWENGKYVAAICAGPTVLADLGITDGKDATCYPGCEEQMGSANMLPDRTFVWDGKLITGTSAGCAIPFGLALIAALRGHEIADTVAAQIVMR